MESQMKEVDQEMRQNAKKIQSLENGWLHKKHFFILKHEAVGRLKMTKKCHEILKEYLEMNSMSLGSSFYDKEIEFKKWIALWEKEQAKNEELEAILGDGVNLDEEINKLEAHIKQEEQKAALWSKNNLSGFNRITSLRNRKVTPE